jgi:hypothetical protein
MNSLKMPGLKKKLYPACRIAIYLAALTACLFILSVFTAAASYSYLSTDDYIHAETIGVYQVGFGRLLVASFRFAANEYMTWQGTYFSMFLQALLSPVNGAGAIELEIVMIINCLLFFVSLLILLWSIGKCLAPQQKSFLGKWFFVYTLIITLLMWCQQWSEVFYWYSGSVSYSFPMAFAFLGGACLLHAEKNQQKVLFGFACFLMLCAVGGSLEIAGAVCYALLLYNGWGWMQQRRFYKMRTSLFGITVAGALVNTIAPGNYLRHSHFDKTGLHVLQGLIDAAVNYGLETKALFRYSFLAVAMLVVFFFGLYKQDRFAYTAPRPVLGTGLLSVLSLLLWPLVTCFPVALAHSSQWLPLRCAFVVDFILICSFLACSYILGWMAAQLGFSLPRSVSCLILTGCCILYILTANHGIRDTVPFRTLYALRDGSIQRYGELYTAAAEAGNLDEAQLPEIPDVIAK